MHQGGRRAARHRVSGIIMTADTSSHELIEQVASWTDG
jgi:hypothetical protein